MQKVTLPREVAEALEKAKKWADIHNVSADVNADFIAWCVPQAEMAKNHGEYWRVLYEFGNSGGFLKLIDALRYGYDVMPSSKTEE